MRRYLVFAHTSLMLPLSLPVASGRLVSFDAIDFLWGQKKKPRRWPGFF